MHSAVFEITGDSPGFGECFTFVLHHGGLAQKHIPLEVALNIDRQTLVIIDIAVNCDACLLQIIEALTRLGTLFRTRECRHEDGRQNGNYRNDDQQFNKSKAVLYSHFRK